MTSRLVFFLVLSLNLLAVSAGVIIYIYIGVDSFTEDGFITKLSVFQLLVIGWLSYNIFRTQRIQRRSSLWRDSSFVWLIIALGFLFLAVDELFLVHENIDNFIHDVFNMEETALTDRIDDFLVGLYGLAGIGVLFVFRDELKAYRETFVFFVIGFVLFFVMIPLDMLINRNDILPLIFEQEHASILSIWVAFIEDSLKVFAEVFFVVGFFAILQKSKEAMEENPVG
ncbi:hypothetical protein [Desulfogranum marinum]|uniref:hypothetical protein n=2 Tax=Desulfogranum marinum TaxID=453220 RepID=UPI0019661676|nr:hypothetical protein [Desulfogranum marinum]MBM9514917.1 hypothetical protein [Desulfogranum marinum]